MPKKQPAVEQLPLPFMAELIACHCFFGCPYVARSADPVEAHRLMEQHYIDKHSQQIERIIGRYK